MRNLFFKLILLSFVSTCVYAQSIVVNIDSIYFNKDNAKRIILINKNVVELNSLSKESVSSILSSDSLYVFDSPIKDFEVGVEYNVADNQDVKYSLYFTQLPIIHIYTKNTIVDEPKVVGSFSLCEGNGNFINHLIGIEYRGGFTQSVIPKKSYLIEFWKDSIGENTKDYSLLGMRKDDDWNLQAMYNQPLRVRSKLCFELWNEIDTLYYAKLEPEARNTIKSEFVELFFNDEYAGLYALTERIDAKQLKLKAQKDDDEDTEDAAEVNVEPSIHSAEYGGELYKGISWGGAVVFSSLPTCTNSDVWGGFEYEYPKKVFDWTNLYNFVKFVVAKNSVDFNANIASKFCVDNAVDYFIFLNLIRATDNSAKNIYIAKYKNDEPYFYVPWDLDGTFGIIYDGNQENVYNNILTNGLFNMFRKDTLENGFQDKLRKRWHTLRAHTITEEHIIEKFKTQYEYLENNTVYLRERLAWPNCSTLNCDNLDYTMEWLKNRIAYLDDVFMYKADSDEFANIDTVDKNGLVVYPNPSSSYVCYNIVDLQCVGAKVSIMNALGEILISQSQCLNFGKIDVSKLSDGVYFLVVDSKAKQRQVQKLIIKN